MERQNWVDESSQEYERRRRYTESRSRSTWAGTHPTRQKHRFWSRPRTQGANIASFISIPQTPPRKVRRREPLYAFEFHWRRTGPTRHTRIETYQLSKPNKARDRTSKSFHLFLQSRAYTPTYNNTTSSLRKLSHTPLASSELLVIQQTFLPDLLASQRHSHFTPNAITTHHEPTQYNTIQHNTLTI